MTKEDKQLLLTDLCARLPYGVKVAIEYSEGKYTRIYDLREIDNDVTSELRQQVTVWNYGFYSSVISYPLIDCRPYLRPMSSMTEEEKDEMFGICTLSDCSVNTDWESVGVEIMSSHPRYGDHYSTDYSVIDWLNKNMFDYRGLIPKGLALEAPKGMYKEEQQ